MTAVTEPRAQAGSATASYAAFAIVFAIAAPAMYWYGWLATTLIGAAIAGLAATLLPRNVIGRIPLFLIWLLPLLVLPILAYALMPFWTR